jgi:hypothetical protein
VANPSVDTAFGEFWALASIRQVILRRFDHHGPAHVAPDSKVALELASLLYFYLDARNRDARRPTDRPFLHTLGYTHLGPLVLGFGLWLAHKAREQGISDLYFLARDGHLMHRVHQRMIAYGFSRIPGHYLMASRRAWVFPGFDTLDTEAFDAVLQGSVALPLQAYLDRLGIAALAPQADAMAHFHPRKDRGTLEALLRPFSESWQAQAEKERAWLLSYLAQEGIFTAPKAGLVDIGWHGSLQASLERLWKKEGYGGLPPIGFYLGTFRATPAKLPHHAYLFKRGFPGVLSRSLRQSVELMEWFYCAPHGSVEGFQPHEGSIRPRFGTCSADEIRHSLADPVQEGALAFVDDALQNGKVIRPPGPVIIPPSAAFGMIQALLSRPSAQEAAYLGRIPHSEAQGAPPRPLAPASFSPLRLYRPALWPLVYKGWRESFWRPAFWKRFWHAC